MRAIESLGACAVQLANGRVYPLTRETRVIRGNQSTVVVFTDTEERISFASSPITIEI